MEQLSSSPQIDSIFSAIKHYSPLNRINEEQVIEQIRVIGDSLFDSDEEDIIVLHHQNEVILGTSEVLENSKEKYNFAQIGVRCGTFSSMSKAKSPPLEFSSLERMRRQKERLNISQEEIASCATTHKQRKPVKPTKVTQRESISHALNYQRYIKRRVDSDLKQKLDVEIKREEKPTMINVHDGTKYNQVSLRTKGSKEEVKCAVINVVQRGKAMMQRKEQKQQLMREESLKKEIDSLLAPSKLAKQYPCKKKFVEGTPKLSNFMKRLEVNKTDSEMKEIKLIDNELKRLTFAPKVNQISTAHSRIKSIWSREDKLGVDSAMDLVESRVSREQSLVNENKSLSSTQGLSLKNVQEMNFLLQ